MEVNKQVKFDRKSLVDSVDASLKRLRTDYIDLLLLHVTPSPMKSRRPSISYRS